MARSNFNSLIPTCLMSYTDIIREFRSDVKPFFGMHYLYFSFFKGAVRNIVYVSDRLEVIYTRGTT